MKSENAVSTKCTRYDERDENLSVELSKIIFAQFMRVIKLILSLYVSTDAELNLRLELYCTRKR